MQVSICMKAVLLNIAPTLTFKLDWILDSRNKLGDLCLSCMCSFPLPLSRISESLYMPVHTHIITFFRLLCYSVLSCSHICEFYIYNHI